MFKDVIALLSCLHHKHQAFGDLFLAVEVIETGRAQSEIERSLGSVDRFLKVGF